MKSAFAGLIAPLTLGLAVLTACSEPTAPGESSDVTALTEQITEADLTPTPGVVRVCKVGPEGTYDFTATLGAAQLGTLTSAFSVAADDCLDIWAAAPLDGATTQPTTQVIVTETVPTGFRLDSILVIDRSLATPEKVVGSTTATAGANNVFHGSVLIFYNSELPPCVGLTPGYWRNWANHYTRAQFLSLLPGTIAEGMTAEAATAILAYGGSDPVPRLRKFVLANQLTLNLTGTSLPNPDRAGLHPDCTLHGFQGNLGSWLSSAYAILANPGAYTRAQINAVKDALDAFANMG